MDLEDQIFIDAINSRADIIVNTKPIWKPGKDISHLETRKLYEHIPEEYTMDDYNNLIMDIVEDINVELYFYPNWMPSKYFVLRKEDWIVMFGMGGLMESAYRTPDFEGYKADHNFVYMGTVEEVLMKWM